jgi:hypothetical protein
VSGSPCGRPGRPRLRWIDGDAPALDNFFSYPHTVHVWFIYVACSWQAPPRRLNQSAPEIVIISSGAFIATASTRFRCRNGSAASELRVCLMD